MKRPSPPASRACLRRRSGHHPNTYSQVLLKMLLTTFSRAAPALFPAGSPTRAGPTWYSAPRVCCRRSGIEVVVGGTDGKLRALLLGTMPSITPSMKPCTTCSRIARRDGGWGWGGNRLSVVCVGALAAEKGVAGRLAPARSSPAPPASAATPGSERAATHQRLAGAARSRRWTGAAPAGPGESSPPRGSRRPSPNKARWSRCSAAAGEGLRHHRLRRRQRLRPAGRQPRLPGRLRQH